MDYGQPMPRRPRRRPTLRDPEPIGGLVGRVDLAGGPQNRAVPADVWDAAVGPRITERAQPIAIEQGTLIIRVATSVWASELSLLAVPILARLTAAGLEVRALRCRVGALDVKARAPSMRTTRAVPPPLPLPPALEGALAAVDDAELRQVISDAARANLAWQAYVGDASGGTAPRATSAASRAARVPQSAGTGSDQPDRTTGAGSAAPRRRP